MFNPHAPSNRNTSIAQCYRKHEQEKRRSYDQRIREIEHASFTPLVLSATGGLAEVFLQKASLSSGFKVGPTVRENAELAEMQTLLLSPKIQCIRGARSSRGHAVSSTPPIDLVIEESQVNH